MPEEYLTQPVQVGSCQEKHRGVSAWVNKIEMQLWAIIILVLGTLGTVIKLLMDLPVTK